MFTIKERYGSYWEYIKCLWFKYWPIIPVALFLVMILLVLVGLYMVVICMCTPISKL